MQEEALQINRPHVVDETIDGETILIHLGTGVYYSLDGTASVVWRLLAGGASAATIASMLSEAYPSAPAGILADVEALLGELAGEGLVRAGGAPEAGTFSPAGSAETSGVPSLPGQYEAPVLHRYTDMQAFMLTDPLHDVDEEAGWPHVRPA